VSGGPERYLFNITELLEKNGHTVIPFSIKHNKNRPTEYSDYFMDAVGTGDEIFAHEYKKDYRTILKALGRMLYSFYAKKKFKTLLKNVKPDLVYSLYFQNKMSGSVIDVAYDLKIPVVQRISDFGLICANNVFFIYQNNEICERCLHGTKMNAVLHKCVNDSYLKSFIKIVALKIQDFQKTTDKISAFVIPSEFTAQKFREWKISSKKINCIPTFYNNKYDDDADELRYESFFLYVGRVDPDKGVMTMVKAFEETPYKLIIIGSSIEGYDGILKDYLKDKNHNISFTGKLDFKDIQPYLRSCLCTICPSVSYDNLPNSVLESYGNKKAVIASRLGSLIDLIIDNQTGLSFCHGNHIELRSKVEYLYANQGEARRLGEQAYEKLLTDYSENLHYDRLLHLFNSVLIQ
jgi:glycosyltransferase involved in cell wall biosynthesis